MRCEDVRRLLDEDGALGTAEVTSHIADCQGCRSEVARWAAMRRELRAMRNEAPPPFLHARVMAHVRAEAARPRLSLATRLRLAFTPVLIVAAFAIVMVGGGSFWLLQRKLASPDLGVQEAVSNTLRKEAAAPEAPAPTAGLEAPEAKKLRRQEAPATKAEEARDREQEDMKTAPAPVLAAKVVTATSAPPPPEVSGEATGGAVPLDEWAQRHQHATQATSALPIAAPSPRLGASVERDSQEQPAKARGAVADKADLDAGRSAGAVDSNAKGQESRPDRHATMTAGKDRRRLAEVCAVTPETGGEPVSIELPLELAPPPGSFWRVTVLDDGRLRLGTAEDEPLATSLAQELARALTRHELAPGRYRLACQQ